MINRPENIYSYMFTALLVLQASLLLFWATAYPSASSYEEEIILVANRMLQTGNWLLPELKPGSPVDQPFIFTYWLSAAGYAILPFKLLGFRIFHILFYLIAFWGFFRSVRTFLDARTGFYSACILACFLPFSWQMQLATPDGLATILIGASLFGFYLLLKTNQKKFFWQLYISLGFALITKVFVSVILPMLIMVVYLMFKIKMNGTTLQKLKTGKGLLLTFMIALPWYVKMGVQTGSWLGFVQTGFNREPVVEGEFWMPFLFILLMTLPFGLLLPKSFSFSWKYRFKKDLLLLSGLSVLLVLFFQVFSDTFYAHNLLPALPFAAILIAYFVNSVAGRTLQKMKVPYETGLLVLLSFLLTVFCWFYLNDEVNGSLGRTLSFWILITILPICTGLTILLWSKKRTDEGIGVLVFGYLAFFTLLIHFAQASPDLASYLRYILY